MNIIDFCTRIGQDPLLVQGAGGNVSWKDGDVLWVKASGTWLADADKNLIFVPVALAPLQDAFKQGDFSVTPTLVDASYALKPSIETLLHALMPHPIVVHLHAVEIIAHLVRADCDTTLPALIPTSVAWTLIDYQKPGAPLAQAVHNALSTKPSTDVVLLKNHGVVIGGNSIQAIETLLNTLIQALASPIKKSTQAAYDASLALPEFVPVPDSDIHALAFNPDFFNRLEKDWALFPDHIVFLGPKPHLYNINEHINPAHDLIFVRDHGVWVKPTFSKAKFAQLRCYYDVLCRQPINQKLSVLNADQIAELLHWDAEQYRINMEK